MVLVAWVILVGAGFPLWRAWLANRESSLLHAVCWAGAAWLGWVTAALVPILQPSADATTSRYFALALCGCASVAVLGARRPGVGAWNFVVAGLLLVLLLPVAQGLGRPRLEWMQTTFLGGTLAVGVLNYLPTRLGGAAFLFGCGCAWQFARLASPDPEPHPLDVRVPLADLLLGTSPWVALLQLQGTPASQFDSIWLDFRDRYGLVWGQRVREQFNRSAAHAGWPVILRWQGLRIRPGSGIPPTDQQEEILATLRALLKRFTAREEIPE